MPNSALIIGYGSIGQRHAKIMDSMKEIETVSVLSNQDNIPFQKLNSMQDIRKLDPDYIIIASPTSFHYEQLVFLDKNVRNKKILVEKPLFDNVFDFSPVNNSVWVAYMFRFHPILQLIKQKLSDKLIWNVNIFCGSFLPDWRPGRDYRKIYSSKKELGGGVLLDLSHELDYIIWLLGHFEIDYVFNDKISSLDITSDDLLILNGHTKDNAQVQINLNYFTKEPLRKIIIDGDDINIQADLLLGKVKIIIGEKIENYDFSDLNINEIYRMEHEAILSGDSSLACTFDQGLEMMHMIDRIRNFDK